MLPIYSVLHFAPAVLFKWKASIQDPGKVLVRSGLGSLRSSAFLGVFVVIYQGKLTSMLIDRFVIKCMHQACSVTSINFIKS